MKVLLLVPKYTYNNKSPKKNYHYFFPMGLAYISAVLKDTTHEIDIVNLNHKDGTIEELINFNLNRKEYDVVLSGEMALGYNVIEKMVMAIRKHRSNPKIIIGGAIITSEPHLMIKNLDFDYGIVGEGENTIVELLECLENKGDAKNVDGLCWKGDNGVAIFTNQRVVINDLDSLPFPDYEGFEFGEYLDNMSATDALFTVFDYPRMYPLLASRGCPYQCTFCYHSLGPKYRDRSMDNIMEEIEYAIKKFRINSINVTDDLFSINKDRVYEFCKRIKEIIDSLDYDFKWACQLTVSSVDKDLLKTMKDAGCFWVSFGFESYSPVVLKSMKKPITPEHIRNSIKWCLELEVGFEGAFIFGDSAETNETAKETLDFWVNECQGQIGIFFIQPYPGSEMYNRAIKKGVIKDKMDFIRNKICKTNFINMTDSMSDKDFKNLVRTIAKLRAKHCKYQIHDKIIKEGKDKYEVQVKCPFCKVINKYKNCYLPNPHYYTIYNVCRHCAKRYYAVSRLYKFTINYYTELDLLRRSYLYVQNVLKAKRI